MGIRKQDLIPVRLTMCGAMKEDLEVMGGRSRHRHQGHLWLHPINAAALLCLRQDGDSLPLQRSTRRPVSHLAWLPCCCHRTFNHRRLYCPRCGQEPPPIPTTLPTGLPAMDGNVEALREWLLDHYGATTFNMCEHHPLTLMKGESLQLHVDSNATTVAIHKPALVPLHW